MWSAGSEKFSDTSNNTGHPNESIEVFSSRSIVTNASSGLQSKTRRKLFRSRQMELREERFERWRGHQLDGQDLHRRLINLHIK